MSLAVTLASATRVHNHKPYGLLNPLPVPDQPWTSISVDFITQLPPSKGFTAICVFVDRFTKMAHFAPTTDNVDAEGTVALFLKHVFSLHGLPDDVVSDRGVTFTAKFTQEILKALKIQQNLSTAYHQQTDGQTERTNAILEQYLHCYVDYQQSDWSTLLPLLSLPTTTLLSLQLRSHLSLPTWAITHGSQSQSQGSPRPTNQPLIASRSSRNSMLTSSSTSRWPWNDMPSIMTPRQWLSLISKIGDKVWLSSKNIHTTRPTKKLDYKKLGPFKILEKVNNRSYHLDLPQNYKIHPVFHVSLLEHYQPDQIPGRVPRRPPPVEVRGEQEYFVKQIEDSRWFRGSLAVLC